MNRLRWTVKFAPNTLLFVTPPARGSVQLRDDGLAETEVEGELRKNLRHILAAAWKPNDISE